MCSWSGSNDSMKGSCDPLSVYHLCLAHPCWRTKGARDNQHIVQSYTALPLIASYSTHTATTFQPTSHQKVPTKCFPALILHQAARMIQATEQKEEKVPISSFTKASLTSQSDTVQRTEARQNHKNERVSQRPFTLWGSSPAPTASLVPPICSPLGPQALCHQLSPA